MNSVVIYDSAYGNTAKVAKTIQTTLKAYGTVYASLASNYGTLDPNSIDLLVVGSPTQGGKATETMQQFITDCPSISGLNVAVFDTRFNKSTHGFGLKVLMNTIGFAAEKMQKSLEQKGATVVGCKGFIVEDKEGPLAEGELASTNDWVRTIVDKVSKK